jgi:CBS domain-containing protein
MSPRAAWRFERLGFGQVYDYVAGKASWLAFGLPCEGTEAAIPRAGDAARRDVPTCNPGDRTGDVRARLTGTGWDECLVVNEAHVVLGRLRAQALLDADDLPVEEVMEPGPTTIRPNERLTAIAERLRTKNLPRIVVTTPDGRLVGVLTREDAERQT